MENTTFGNQKLFIGLGVVTVICGIGLIAAEQIPMGISGSIVGIWLVFQNIKQMSTESN